MNDRLRELAEREGLPFKVAQATLSRLVVETIVEQERRENQKAAGAREVEPPCEAGESPSVEAEVVRIDEQREKRGRRHRHRCESCRGRFTASRRHARFCSVACRMRAYRKRRAA